MTTDDLPRYTVFDGYTRLAAGSLAQVALAAKAAMADRPLLIFEDQTGRALDIDMRGTEAEMLARLGASPEVARKPGRPRLGVTAREVTLLPRHWDWLAAQPGGASVALRKLVEAASRSGEGQARQSRDAAYRFMSAIGGDLPGFEEATRALYAGERDRFEKLIADWPADVRDHAIQLAFPTVEAAASPAQPGP